jgi:alpha-tubulin suppressor-like RCC1 family protein
MIGVDPLVAAVNSLISGGSLSDLQVTQLSAAVLNLQTRGISSVASVDALPPPELNTGRFFWIESEQRYVFSNGQFWDINLIFLPQTNLYAWGCNTNGSLGDSTTINRSSPVSVVGNLPDWTMASAGLRHSLATRAGGSAWAWGNNLNGRLGDNSTENRSSPVSIVGGFSDWTKVSAGVNHSAGLTAGGTAWAWGLNADGSLGDNTSVDRSSPVSVVGGFANWTQISAGFNHTLALQANGTIWGWGYNGDGRLGRNTAGAASSSPASVVGGFTNWIQISAGFGHSVGLQADGTIWTWGTNGSGQLGDNSTSNRSSPVSVVGGFVNWTQISGGGYHTLALRAEGTLWAWGNNTSGRLGDNSTENRSSPVSVVGGFTDWASVDGGFQSSGATRTNGSVWCWGNNINGQIGDGSTADRSSPVSLASAIQDWVDVSAGGRHNLGVRA